MRAKTGGDDPSEETGSNRRSAVHLQPSISAFIADHLGLKANHQFFWSAHFERPSGPTVGSVSAHQEFARYLNNLSVFSQNKAHAVIKLRGFERNGVQPQLSTCFHALLDHVLVEPFPADNIGAQGAFRPNGNQRTTWTVNQRTVDFL